MKMLSRTSFLSALLIALLALALPLRAADAEDKLIKDMESKSEETAWQAMQKYEKQFPTSTKAFPVMKKLLTDPRAKVRRKAARVLGVLHADASEDDLKAVTAMLKAPDAQEQMDALKSLRGLKGGEKALPEILPMLKSSTPNVVRDACRAISTLGTKANIPDIEPLLNNANPAVKKDAQDAIFALKNK
jgi:HEAT repeat protein